jgi:hypothetical protein
MTSVFLRPLSGLLALCFGLLGALLFVAPGWAAGQFPWTISPFVAMHMGGWYLGSAVFAWEVFRARRWPAIYACLPYLWAYGIGEAALLVAYRDVLHLDTALAWLYIATFAVAVLTAIAGTAEVLPRRPVLPAGTPIPNWVRAQLIIFIFYASSLGLVLLTGRSRGEILFREPVTPLTAHAFGAFYLALVLGVVVLIWCNALAPVRIFMRGALALIVPITVASVVYHTDFDFGSRPLGLLYFATYFGSAIAATAMLIATRTPRAESSAESMVTARGTDVGEAPRQEQGLIARM